MNRKTFINGISSALAASIIEAHFRQNWSFTQSVTTIQPSSPLIESIEICAATSIARLKNFYHTQLGFRVVSESSDTIRFEAGQSFLSFISVTGMSAKPFYHFAFNIPENKILKAYHWQKKITPIVFPRPGMSPNSDGLLPEDIVHFRQWNAHSIFFIDPAGNLVEYIARHSLNNGKEGEFSVRDILYISEIGLITDRVVDLSTQLQQFYHLPLYLNSSDSFQPVGNEYGLLLSLKKGIEWTGLNDRDNHTNIFPTRVKLTMQKGETFVWSDHPYTINHL